MYRSKVQGVSSFLSGHNRRQYVNDTHLGELSPEPDVVDARRLRTKVFGHVDGEVVHIGEAGNSENKKS